MIDLTRALLWRSVLPGIAGAWLVGLAGAFVLRLEGAGAMSLIPLGASAAATLLLLAWASAWVIGPSRRLQTRLMEAAQTSVAPNAGEEVGDLLEGIASLAKRCERTEASLRRERANISTLLEGHSDAAFVVEQSGRILWANPSAVELFGVGGAQMRGASIRDLATREKLLSLLGEAQGGAIARGSVRIPTRHGERTFETVAAPWRSDETDQACAMALMRDVTDLAEALRIRTDFVANASHELRTPLTAIRVAIETLQSGARDDPEMGERLLSMVAAHVNRLESLVQDLLDLARVEGGGRPIRVEVFDRELLIRSMLAEFDPVCRERSVRIEFDWPESLTGFLTAPTLLGLSLRNLLDNATKFCYEGTAVVVRGRETAAGIRIEVVDRGVGIPLGQQQRVFERFYQVDQARSGGEGAFGLGAKRGTGLGLSIVRHAMRTMGGEVGIESVLREGTTAWLEAPIPPRLSAQRWATEARPAAREGGAAMDPPAGHADQTGA